MRDENPFRDWLGTDRYGGTRVPVGGLGGWLGPASVPVLVPAGRYPALLESTEWPLQVDSARPEVWEDSEGNVEASLHPRHERDGLPLEPLVAYFNPPARPSWLEPIQAFVLFHEAVPRHLPERRIVWEVHDEDGRPEEISRWTRPGDDEPGVLEIRRDRLFDFMRTFDYDLVDFFEENRGTDEVPDEWRDEGREELRTWRCWSSEVMPGEVRAVLRCVTAIPCPPPVEADEDPVLGRTLEYPIGTDPGTGQPIMATYPGPPNDRTTWPGAGNDNFLTPVYFRREVLDQYLREPRYYSVETDYLRAGGMWGIPFAITSRGNVQVWLGDLGRISDRAQRHFQQYAITDDDEIPEYRLRRDLGAEFIDTPSSGAVDDLRRGIDQCNEAAIAHCGQPLFSPVEGMSEQRVATLHKPLTDSFPEFQQQVTSLAILLVDHLDSGFFKAVGAPDGPKLNSLAAWLGREFEISEQQAKDEIGGLYAVQAVRSSGGGAHRAGSRAVEVLARAGIDPDSLPDGFESLARRAVDAVERLRTRLESLGEPPSAS